MYRGRSASARGLIAPHLRARRRFCATDSIHEPLLPTEEPVHLGGDAAGDRCISVGGFLGDGRDVASVCLRVGAPVGGSRDQRRRHRRQARDGHDRLRGRWAAVVPRSSGPVLGGRSRRARIPQLSRVGRAVVLVPGQTFGVSDLPGQDRARDRRTDLGRAEVRRLRDRRSQRHVAEARLLRAVPRVGSQLPLAPVRGRRDLLLHSPRRGQRRPRARRFEARVRSLQRGLGSVLARRVRAEPRVAVGASLRLHFGCLGAFRFQLRDATLETAGARRNGRGAPGHRSFRGLRLSGQVRRRIRGGRACANAHGRRRGRLRRRRRRELLPDLHRRREVHARVARMRERREPRVRRRRFAPQRPRLVVPRIGRRIGDVLQLVPLYPSVGSVPTAARDAQVGRARSADGDRGRSQRRRDPPTSTAE